jgi:small ligand-binding sensory domain FIST
MDWASAAASGPDLDEILDTALARVGGELPDGRADLVFLFLAAEHAGHAERALAAVRRALGDPHVLGCGAGGVIGGGREFEHVPALSLLAGRIPGAATHGFHLDAADLPDPDGPPRAWHEAVGISPADLPSFVLVGDPFTLPAERLLAGLDFAYPDSVKVGGLASGARREGEQVLFHGDRVVRRGAVGVALMGDIELTPAVAQGCRALGRPMRITGCEGHLLEGLDEKPVLEALQQLLAEADPRDRSLAEQALFLGFEMDPFAPDGEKPWLIRNLLGIDPNTRGLWVGEALRRGRRVRFHVRDRQTSAEDVESTLARADPRPEATPRGALLFSCLGRGRTLYGAPDHDSRAFSNRFEGVPIGGFFCGGEIGPVGRDTHLHGYTSSFGLLGPRPQPAAS